jgi:hypothetical protein
LNKFVPVRPEVITLLVHGRPRLSGVDRTVSELAGQQQRQGEVLDRHGDLLAEILRRLEPRAG